MAVNYLARAGRRVSAEPAPRVRPAMPIRSPVVAADQRLNFDAFAQHVDARFPRTPAPEEGEVAGELQDPTSELQPRVNDQRRARVERRLGASPRDAVRPGTQPPVVPPIREVAPHRRPDEHERADASEFLRPRTASGYFPEAPEPRKPDVRHQTPGEPAERHQRAWPTQIVHETHTITPATPQPGRGETAPDGTIASASVEPSVKRVLDAVKRATSWIEAEQRPAGRSQEENRIRSSSQPQDAPVRVRSMPAVTHLEIGRIDVEVVGPATPAVPSRSQGAPSSASLVSSRPVFGWRQR